jgi:hypothetical protein
MFGLVFLSCLNDHLFCQIKKFYTSTDSIYYSAKVDSLKKVFPFCSEIPEGYAVAFYTALSHYPELQQTPITFRQRSLKTSMATRPASRLFGKRSNRGYTIYVNNKAKFNGVYPASLHFGQQVGVIGHELGHILDYSHKSAFRLIGNGIAYLFPSYRRKFEAATDIRTIDHGLGWQLYDYVDYILNHSEASEKYKKMKRKIYLDEKEIKALIP